MWWLLALVVLLLAGWGAVSASWVLNPERRALPLPDPLPAYERHQLTALDGASFDVWRLRPGSALRGRLVICHGYYANRSQVLDIADGLRERGYETLLFELRGHGSRPGPCTLGLKEADDVGVLLRWAAAQDGAHPLPAGILGLSMGGAVACQAAARYPELRAVVADSVYSRFFPVLRRSLRQRFRVPPFPWAWATWWGVQAALGGRLGRQDPAVLARRLRIPLLAIQGGEDRRVVPLLGREFYQRWAGPKERWFEPQVAHVGMFAEHPQAYCDRVAAFFDRTVAA